MDEVASQEIGKSEAFLLEICVLLVRSKLLASDLLERKPVVLHVGHS